MIYEAIQQTLKKIVNGDYSNQHISLDCQNLIYMLDNISITELAKAYRAFGHTKLSSKQDMVDYIRNIVYRDIWERTSSNQGNVISSINDVSDKTEYVKMVIKKDNFQETLENILSKLKEGKDIKTSLKECSINNEISQGSSIFVTAIG